ncbi:MAG: hypothetical protein ACFFEY_20925 [Candidatus Thorarchaeota archaeon]
MHSEGKKLLLMGISTFKSDKLPSEVKKKLDSALEQNVSIIVAEAHGSCRLFQDYLVLKNYKNVVIGHARSLRYNAGGWRDVKYGDNLKERERNMIADCDFAIVIWQDRSNVIAENIERLKNVGKPTFLYEYDSSDGTYHAGELDPSRSYRAFSPYLKKFKDKEKQIFNNWLSKQK